MKIKFVASILLLISIISCTKIIDIDLPPHESKLVVNSLFRPGEKFSINISKTASFIGSTPPGVFNCNVDLYNNGLLMETATSTDSIYNSFFGPSENRVYTIELSSPGMETITATDSVPSKTYISYIESTNTEWVDENGMKYRQLKLRFNDSDNKTNYYEIKLHVRFISPWWPPESGYLIGLAHLGGIPDHVLEEAWLYYGEIGGLVFDDKQFNEGECDLEIFAGILDNEADEYELIVELNSVSEKYYNYKKQLGLYMKSQDSNIFEGVPDPIELYSNIENGYGIFAAYVTDRVILNISK